MNNVANNTIRPFIVAPVTRFLKSYRDEPTFDITEVLRYGEDTVIVNGCLVDAKNNATDCFLIAQESTYLVMGTLTRASRWAHERYRRVEASLVIDFNGGQHEMTHILPDLIRVKRRRFVSAKAYPNYKTGPATKDDIGYFAHDLKTAGASIDGFTEFRMIYRINLHTERLASVIYTPDNDDNRKVLQHAAPVQKVGDVHRHPLRRARRR